MYRRALSVIVAMVVVGCGGGGGGTTGPEPQVVASVTVAPGTDTLLALGLTRQLTATARTASGSVVTGKTFTWSSSAPAIASVDPSSGLVTAVGRGNASITAAVDGKSGQASVLVAQQVSTVEVSPGTAGLLAIGANQQFSAVAKDGNGAVVTGVTFLWVSSDQSVATVDNTGKATAKAPGSTTITAAALGVPGTAALTVTQVATQLALSVQPTGGTEGLLFGGAVQVEIRDANGALVAGARDLVTLGIGTNPSGGTLGGTTAVNAVGGIATFGGLTIDRAGTGYTLSASAPGLGAATSTAFNVFLRFVGISAGNVYTCGVTASGEAWCWGRNFLGQLGDGTAGAAITRPLPVKVLAPAGIRFTSVSAGTANTTCGITTNGATYCWGAGNGAELGNGIIANVTTPALTLPPAGVSFTTLSNGSGHTCAISLLGVAYCWGQNSSHQLGDGTTTIRSLPLPVTMPAGQTFATITARGPVSCATTAAGAAYCWGLGGIGDGSAAERFVPTAVLAPGLTFVTAQSAGGIGCALSFTGLAYCWGDLTLFAAGIGDGTALARLAPVPVTMPAGTTFTQLAVGGVVACALTPSGAAYCWGLGSSGNLGNGSFGTQNAPGPVTMPAGVTFTVISSGVSHVCALTALGAVYCWGGNASGQLGDGTTSTRSTPVRVQR